MVLRPDGSNIKDDSIQSADIKDGTIVNADINTSAGIALSKLQALTVNKIVVTDNSGVLSASALSTTDITNKATIDSPSFTGLPTAPTANLGDNTTKLATTAFVQGLIDQVNTGNYAPVLAGTGLVKTDNTLSIGTNLDLTGVPTAPTATQGTNTTQVASTQFVRNELGQTKLTTSELYVDKFYNGTMDGTVHRPYNRIQLAINAGYQSGYNDVTIYVKAGTEYTENLLFDRNQLGLANSTLVHIGVISHTNTNDAVNVKVNGSITISGNLTTRVKLQNLQIAPTGGTTATALTIQANQGRHYFYNVVFGGKIVFEGAWERWYDFRGGSNYGVTIAGSPVGTTSVSFTDVAFSGASSVSASTVIINNCPNIYGVTHTAGTLAILRSGFLATGLNSSATSGFLLIQDTSFFNGSAFTPLNKSGACPYVFNNVSRSGTDTINGYRFKLGASSNDFQFVPTTPSQFSNLSELSVGQALNILGSGVSTSDRKFKIDLEELNEKELRVASKLKGLIKKYKFIDQTDNKFHVGVIAQEVEDTFIKEGLNPHNYAILQKEFHIQDGVEITTYGINYQEMFAFIISTL